MQRDFDLLVIGAGSAGVRMARMSAGHGARVALVESGALGGTCVNVGCIPKKLFVYASHVQDDIEDGAGFGWQIDRSGLRFDWATLRDNKTREIQRLNGVYRQLLDKAGVEILSGRARLVDPHTVAVGERQVSADRIVIATGSAPVRPDVPGAEHLLISDDMFSLAQLPDTAVVIGGGYIAVEFAGILAGLGVQTTLLYRGDLILRGFDEDVRRFVQEDMQRRGIDVRTQVDVHKVEKHGDQLTLLLSDGSSLTTGLALAATGRRPLVDGLGLESIGVALGAGGKVLVDAHFRTQVPSVYALGDVIGTPQLTPVALAQAMVLSRRLYGDGQGEMDYDLIPTAVFCEPNIATVGLNETQALAQGLSLRIYESRFRPLKHTLTGRETRCYMKLVVDDVSDRVLGIHMAGPDVAEILQGFAVALRAGATKAVFDATLGIHPSAAEELVTLRQPSRFVSPH